jgi:protein-tyrosine-phosphatase
MSFNPYLDFGSPAVKQDQCFIVMPYGQPWSGPVWDDIRRLCESEGLSAVRGDDRLGSNILSDIWRDLHKSRAIIVDVTGNNPNVMYELGLAHALKKDVILLAQTADDIPFDLRVFRHILYDPGDAGRPALGRQLTRCLAELFLRDNFDRIIGPEHFVLIFLSTGGTCRCAMSNVIARHLLAQEKSQQAVEDGPPGLKTLSVAQADRSLPQMSPGAQKMVRRLGLDGSRHKTLRATEALLRRADLILPMSAGLAKALPDYQDKVHTFMEFFGRTGDIEDPWNRGDAAYDGCFELIRSVLQDNVDRLAALRRRADPF